MKTDFNGVSVLPHTDFASRLVHEGTEYRHVGNIFDPDNECQDGCVTKRQLNSKTVVFTFDNAVLGPSSVLYDEAEIARMKQQHPGLSERYFDQVRAYKPYGVFVPA